MALQIDVSDENGFRVIRPVGEVDLNTSRELRRIVLDTIKEKRRIGVDLSHTEYMDSSGVATLVEALKSSSVRSREFVLLRPSEPVMKVLRLARLDALFTILDAPNASTAGGGA